VHEHEQELVHRVLSLTKRKASCLQWVTLRQRLNGPDPRAGHPPPPKHHASGVSQECLRSRTSRSFRHGKAIHCRPSAAFPFRTRAARRARRRRRFSAAAARRCGSPTRVRTPEHRARLQMQIAAGPITHATAHLPRLCHTRMMAGTVLRSNEVKQHNNFSIRRGGFRWYTGCSGPYEAAEAGAGAIVNTGGVDVWTRGE
jgi:hypothetical protein